MKKFYQLFLSLMVFAIGSFVLSSCEKEKPTELFLNNTTLTMEVGATAQLVETVLPMGVEYEITWLTNQASVAEVSNKGLVTAKGVGEAEITAIVADLRKTCKVTVKELVKDVKISLSAENRKVNEGSEFTITATVTPAEKFAELQWKSSDETVATVDKGVVKGVKVGNAVITAFIGEVKAECAVEVVGKEEEIVVVELDHTTKNMFVGDELTLKATVTPASKESELVWATSDDKIATVDKGVVKAIAEGSVDISASVGEEKAVCKITVKKADGLTIELSHETYEGLVGAKFQLTATVDPDDKKDDLVWGSKDKSIATIAEDGLVSLIAEGETEITATIDDVVAVCKVKVNAKSEALSLVLDDRYTDGTFSMLEEESHPISFTVEPDERHNDVVWSSADEKIATVSYSRIYAKAVGQTTITGKLDDIEVSFTLTVNSAPTKISLNKTSATISINGELKLIPSITPTSAQSKEVTWKSDNQDVATVGIDGTVKGVSAGIAIITATVDGATAECRINVWDGEFGEIKSDWELYEVFDVAGYGKGLVVDIRKDIMDGHIKSITVMHMEFENLAWAKDAGIVVGNADRANQGASGLELTNMIADVAKTCPDNFPAFNWVRSLGPNWYMPNGKELSAYAYMTGKRKIEEKLVELGYEKMPESIWGAKEGHGTYTNCASFIDDTYHYPREASKTVVRGVMALMKINLDEINNK